MIALYRVDERVIHGQTTTRLTKEYPCDGVLIIDDTIAADPFMMNIYKNVLPKTIKVLGFTVEKALTKLPEAEASQRSYYVVFKRTTTLKALVERGYVFKCPVYIGPQSVREDTKTYITMCSLTKGEAEALDYVTDRGVKVIVDPRFDTPDLTWQELREKK